MRNLKWFNGLSDEDKKVLKGDLVTARPALERLQELLEVEHKEIVSSMVNKKSFSLDWKHYQASMIGELKAIETLQKLIKE